MSQYHFQFHFHEIEVRTYVTQFAVQSFQNHITKFGYRDMKAILLSFAEIGFLDRFTAPLTISSHTCPWQFPSLLWWPSVLIGK